MRNWNFLWRIVENWPSYGLDRTYEELKQAEERAIDKDPSMFGSYLWGIETFLQFQNAIW